MKTNSCPYVKISDSEASKLVSNTDILLSNKNFFVKKENNVTPEKINFSLIATAHAQGNSPQGTNNFSQNLSDQLTVPFLFFVFSFFLFIILMSVVYIYHWEKFSMNDPFIKNFSPVFFVGLVVLLLPLIINLFF